MASSATQASGERDKLSVRRIMLSEHPADDTRPIYVKGQVVTTLRFEQLVDPSKTKMIGWEGRLEPLAVVRNKVLLEPIHDLNKDEGIPLVVTLADGTEIPFLVRPPWSKSDGGWMPITDQQVDVFKDRESYAAMHAALMDALKKNDTLTEENQRYRKEETSEDHALAALLASGAVAQTPFMIASHITGKDDDTEIKATLFRGKGKAAVVFNVKNLAPEQPWSVKSARLLTVSSGRESAVAVRSTSSSIAPGESGVVAVVADRSAFIEDGKLASVFLEIYRHDGMRQALVQLDPALVAR
ncbi:DUF2381 family protein [Myxococcus sp. RHSTA-1-4]|uniref:DUF2381 family protein n=1 Tax=Myxococcus sp. RHSTA-1-4 TaxID=2874601 RepID=UPI001CBD5DED|nr:DUF2381 family protein [Myxococcus sp. RHSTA-1-4]MBZ4415251.1 DUF2381 family protein [Myxococcus sp. RHSTA-1-4]